MSHPQSNPTGIIHSTPAPEAPAASTTPSHDAITPAPAPAATTASVATTTLRNPEAAPAGDQTLSFNDKLNGSDRYWKFKAAIRALLIVFGIIGVGTVGWAFASIVPSNQGFNDDYWTLWPALVTFPVSVVWCALCILVLIARKRPVHPGVRVAIDLILWLSFIATALSVTAAVIDLQSWGSNGDLGWRFDSSYGDYELLNNGTWVWQNDRSSVVTYARDCDRNSTSDRDSYRRYSDLGFQTCSEQDAYINSFWQKKPRRVSILTLATVCQYMGLLLHFVLFVWACVDTHRHNRGKVSADAEKLAASIVQNMIANGAIVPPPGQAHMRPAPMQAVYYQYPPQQAYPHGAGGSGRQPHQQPRQQQQPHQVIQGPDDAGPSNEKSVGPRYA